MLANKTRLVLVAAFVVNLSTFAAEAPGPHTNVLVTLDVGSVENGKDVVLKTYEMVLNANGLAVEMATGARIPIPTTTFDTSNAAAGNVVPVTSFTYQQVGFSANINVGFNEDGSIELRGRIEDSSLTETPAADGRPFIQSMEQSFSLTLLDG